MYSSFKKHLLVSFLCLLFFCYLFTDKLLALPKHSSFLILDFNSGAILDSQNAKMKMHPASLTKLMTLYIIFEALEQNIITLSTEIPVSVKTAQMPTSKIGLKAGKTITVQNIINAIIVKSANDAAHAIAEYLGNGSEENFVNIMNQKAKELDLKNTHFVNSTGLTHFDQYSTAYDLSILAKNLMLRFNKYYHLFSQKTFTWNKTIYKSTNHLLDYSNIDGLKTGYTYAAGFNLLVSSEINGFRVIITSLGNKSANARDNLVKQLVNVGIVIARTFRFNNIKYKSPPQAIIAANDLLNQQTSKITTIINSNIDNNQLQITTANKESLIELANTIDDKAKIYTVSLNNNENIAAPIKNKANATYIKNYFVQIGVFSNLVNAQKIANNAIVLYPQFKKQNLKIDLIKKHQSNLYRVRLNKFSHKEATNLCYKLKNNKISCFVGRN